MTETVNIGGEGDGARALETYQGIVEAAGDSIHVLDSDLRFLVVNQRFADAVGMSKDELLGEHVSIVQNRDVVDSEVMAQSEAVITAMFETEPDFVKFEAPVKTTAGDRVVENKFTLLRDDDGDPYAVLDIVRDITERKERERLLERRRDELETLDSINRTIRGINRALVGAATREDVEASVCEALAASDLYRGAFVAERDVGESSLAARAWAGIDEAYVEALMSVDAEQTPKRPAIIAMENGDPVVIPDVAAARAVSERMREETLVRGFHSAVLVPLTYEGTVYGVLAVGSERPNAFGDRERAVFGELGETIGYAINAVHSRRLLHADTVTELEFITDDPDIFVVDVSRRTGCRFALDGIVPASDGRYLYYWTQEGSNPELTAEIASERPEIEEVRTVAATGDEASLELLVNGYCPGVACSQYGGHVREMHVEDGRARLVVELTPDADFRGIVGQLKREFPRLELLAKRDADRPVQTAKSFRSRVDDQLTDRQRAALLASYHAGYYEWPRRESTAVEVAESLGVSSSTFHQHLRSAQKKLLTGFFEH